MGEGTLGLRPEGKPGVLQLKEGVQGSTQQGQSLGYHNENNGSRGVSQLVEQLSSIHEALSSIPKP